MTEQVIRAIEAALKRGLRVELLLDKDGTIKVQTVSRKKLNIGSHALNGGREELNGADRRNPAGSFFICKVR